MPRTSRTLARALRRSSRGQGQSRDAGAAAVEFALVLPILILILFGIIDYGLYFSNGIDAQSGVSTAARQGTVGNLDNSCPTPVDAGGVSNDVGHLMCMVKRQTNPVTGKTYVKVAFPADPNNPGNPTGWFEGQLMLVCEVVDVQGVTGYVPLPSGGRIRTKIATQIEHVENNSVGPDAGGAEGAPPGGWSWCT
jgi:hypothetical protein